MVFMFRKKHLLTFALAVIMAFSMGGAALANGIAPHWDNTRVCFPALTFSGTTAVCDVTIQGMSGTTEIDPTITLQKKKASGGFSADTSWEPSASNGDSFYWSDTRPNCTSGTDYRLKIVADVTRNGTTETITVYSDPVTCP